eukprot:CAMPEP_0183502390 /NCGR_PEP_ID=MMETSP0371-20130417/4199_1 /TAXON_ID=268820 /ORGANISM="Peridinium aciculiferum, Strain PAER-2" /LENGTH=87 /DNA_ID=CAMNT_0025697095 /DNA_START=305 /DNA_END=565 /DNA_ORIENTATION=-
MSSQVLAHLRQSPLPARPTSLDASQQNSIWCSPQLALPSGSPMLKFQQSSFEYNVPLLFGADSWEESEFNMAASCSSGIITCCFGAG